MVSLHRLNGSGKGGSYPRNVEPNLLQLALKHRQRKMICREYDGRIPNLAISNPLIGLALLSITNRALCYIAGCRAGATPAIPSGPTTAARRSAATATR